MLKKLPKLFLTALILISCTATETKGPELLKISPNHRFFTTSNG